MGHYFLQVTLRDKMTKEKVAYFQKPFLHQRYGGRMHEETKTIPLCKYGNKLELLLLLLLKLC